MKEYILPYLSQKEKSGLKIVIHPGHVFYAHNILSEYRYDERLMVIKNFAQYFNSIKNPSPEQDAYSVLLWHLFTDYLNAYNFRWIRKIKYNQKSPKHLYILRNDEGFIKIGVTSNIDSRIIDLKYEFDGNFKIIKIYPFMGKMEHNLHSRLMNYLKPIKRRHGGLSQECFEDCKEVIEVCKNLS